MKGHPFDHLQSDYSAIAKAVSNNKLPAIIDYYEIDVFTKGDKIPTGSIFLHCSSGTSGMHFYFQVPIYKK